MVAVTRESLRRAGADEAVLDVGGWCVFERAVSVDDGTVSRLRRRVSARGTPIFNPDALRVQVDLDADDPLLRRVLRFVEASRLTRGRSVGPAVVLHSRPGCARQDFHTDYSPRFVSRAAVKPLGVLVALQDHTKLCFRDGVQADLSAGDLLVFDGDTVHAGASYAVENTRVHVYLDSPEVPRPHNVSYVQ